MSICIVHFDKNIYFCHDFHFVNDSINKLVLICIVWFGRVMLTIILGTSLFMINLKSQHFRIIESFSKTDSDFPSRSDIQHGHLTMITLYKLGKVLR